MSNPEGWKIALERIAAEKEAKTGFLDLGRLGLTEPPESLFELEHLERLYLGSRFFDSGGNYQISQIDIETNTIGAAFAKLKNLPLLRHLFLSDTNLKSLTPLRKLTQLQTLDCYDTRVSELTPLRELTQLQTLNCSGTQIRTIPEWLVRLPKLTEVVISGEKIQGIPPEVLSEGYGDNCLDPLRAHFDDLAQGSEPLTDVKMIVIGNGRVGKTQICRRLHDGGYVENDDLTHGIQVRSIDFPAENPDNRHRSRPGSISGISAARNFITAPTGCFSKPGRSSWSSGIRIWNRWMANH